MNGTLRNHKKNTNQKSRKPKVEGTDEIDRNGEATMTPQSLEQLKLAKKVNIPVISAIKLACWIPNIHTRYF